MITRCNVDHADDPVWSFDAGGRLCAGAHAGCPVFAAAITTRAYTYLIVSTAQDAAHEVVIARLNTRSAS
jgi:hypothetical protein